MKKIKNFRISCRVRDVLRILKNTPGADPLSDDAEDMVLAELRPLEGLVSAAAVFETLTRDTFPASAAAGASGQWIAATAMAVTIGSAVETQIAQANRSDAPASGRIRHAIALEALDQAHGFIRRIVAEEARQDACELSENTVADSAVARSLGAILPLERVGIFLGDDDLLRPRYSLITAAFWIPFKRRAGRGR